MRRYHLVGGAEQVNLIRFESISLAGLYGTVSQQMMAFVYQQIERQRRAATRAMLELARIGAVRSDQLRARLLNYLQASVRFTSVLAPLAPEVDSQAWLARRSTRLTHIPHSAE